ncbi:MAG: haloacid dehalogenase-like hydrolase [Acidobacteriia bacterium]|nr:haloacid dehalogenase-like hydrolase [Terriglobia bacterium]
MKIQPVLSPAAQLFVDSILAMQPRVAVFDCDGTLWAGDSGADFFYWEVERGLLPAKTAEWAVARYADYKQGNVGEEIMCGEMVTINAQIAEQRMEEESAAMFAQVVEPRIFPEMQHLTRELARAGCSLWAVSSTNVWVVREGVKRFGIPAENVLAASVHIKDGRVTDRLVRVPSGPAKATALREVVRRKVDVCLGNSIHDLEMLQAAQHAVAVNPNPDLEAFAAEKAWKIYWPSGTK